VPDGLRHQIVGHFNPRCARCQRTVMEIQRMTDRTCHPLTLPFDEAPAPTPAQGPEPRRPQQSQAV